MNPEDGTPDLTVDAIREAKHRLNSAVQEYCDLLGQQYVMNWVLIVDIATPETERAGAPMVGVIVPPDQAYVATRGLMAIAEADMAAH